ncbi:t-SNARE [Meredithblackwellia eburnea MCA 4105]
MSGRDRLRDARNDQHPPLYDTYDNARYEEDEVFMRNAPRQTVGSLAAPQSYSMQSLTSAGVDFYSEVGSIQDQLKQLHQNITTLSQLQAKKFSATNPDAESQLTDQLTHLSNNTTSITNSIRNEINDLNNWNRKSPPGDFEFEARKNQIATLQNSFQRALTELQRNEYSMKEKQKEKMKRQIRIVKPDVTEDEIKSIMEDEKSGQQIFAQALSSERVSSGRTALSEVQNRQQELRKIEENILKLAQMMNDMSNLVLTQHEQIGQVEESARLVEDDTKMGVVSLGQAKVSAAGARRKRWIVFFILLAILVIVAAIVAYKVLQLRKKN